MDRVVGLDDVEVDIAMMKTTGDHERHERKRFHAPRAAPTRPENVPANTLGLGSIMFSVEDIEDVLARLDYHGSELVGEFAQYEDGHCLYYVDIPEGIIVGSAEELSLNGKAP